MPRRKTIQPEPLERFEVDGVEVEVRDGDTWLIGRGLHKQKEWELKAEVMLEKVFETTQDRHPSSKDRRILTQPPSARTTCVQAQAHSPERMVQKELYGDAECGVDDSSLRKRTYPFVRRSHAAMFTYL
jgi:hypothetical protein